MNKREITAGDRIFARVLLNGKGILEIATVSAGDMSQLLGTLRHKMRRYQGLAKIYIRNITRGWSLERPLMLYAARASNPAGRRAPSASENAIGASPGSVYMYY